MPCPFFLFDPLRHTSLLLTCVSLPLPPVALSPRGAYARACVLCSRAPRSLRPVRAPANPLPQPPLPTSRAVQCIPTAMAKQDDPLLDFEDEMDLEDVPDAAAGREEATVVDGANPAADAPPDQPRHRRAPLGRLGPRQAAPAGAAPAAGAAPGREQAAGVRRAAGAAPGHEQAAGVRRRDGAAQGGVQRVCFNCGQPGHLIARCRRPAICRYCKKQGHKKEDCPRRRGWRGPPPERRCKPQHLGVRRRDDDDEDARPHKSAKPSEPAGLADKFLTAALTYAALSQQP